MRAVLIAMLMTSCWQGAPPAAPIAPTAPAVTVTPGPQPHVRLASLFHGDHADDFDNQSFEGWPEYAYANLPAISADGSLVAVVEERDGWGHRPVPGIRILAVRGGTHAWFPLVPPGKRPDSQADEAALHSTFVSLVSAANRELAKRRWLPLETPPVATVDELATDRVVTWPIGTHRLVSHKANRDEPQPPTRIAVLDRTGAEVVTISDTATRWSLPATCNLTSWKLVGVRDAPGIALFQLELGMGGHNCDGVVQPHDWRLVAF